MTRDELQQQYLQVRKLTQELCEPLKTEDMVIQPIDDVSPPKWHLGHSSWFYEALCLDKFTDGYQPYHPSYAYVLNSYYESLGERVNRPLRGTISRPTVEEILRYRVAIDERMCELIQNASSDLWEELERFVVLGLNHERQHQELLVCDIKYILGSNPLQPFYLKSGQNQSTNRQTAQPESFIEFKGGIYEMGDQGKSFSYDNEGPAHKVYIDDFKIQNRLVTNGEYLEFVEDGGYQNFSFWLSDAWNLIQEKGWNAPLYWQKLDDEWHEYTMAGLQELNLDSPVCHVSYYEADAYAQWRNKRLPTEQEWEVAARLSKLIPSEGNFIDRRTFHPQPLSGTTGRHGLRQMLGDVWEWTASAYLPYPRYQRLPGPLGEYNGKFMINQMVLRGGSCATSQDHIRVTYRNFFQPDKRWQFKGIRLAENA